MRPRLGIQKAIKELEPHLALLDKAKHFRPSVGIYQSRNQVMRSKIEPIFRAITGAYSLLSDIGYEAAFLIHGTEELGKYRTMFFPYANDLTDNEIDAIENYLSKGGSAIIDLPTDDTEMAVKLAKKFGIGTVDFEKFRYPIYSGWTLRGTGAALNLADDSFSGYCFNERLSLEGDTSVLKYDDNGKTAAIMPSAYNGRLLITGCRLFYSYGLSMHQKTRQVVQAFFADFIEPDFVLEGADEEFHPYLEARANA